MEAARFRLGACVLIALVAVIAGGVPQAGAIGTGIVISQVYGGGGNSGAPYTHDFVELYNPADTPVPLAGLSIQYASASGTGNFGANSGQLTELSGSIQPHRYFLLREFSTAAIGAPLPTPDGTDATPINMSGTAGKVTLVTGTASLGCNGGSTPCDGVAQARIIDLVGYGNANFFEGSAAAPTLSNTTSAQRNNGGCDDTNENGADFAAAATAPRNSSNLHFCDSDQAPRVSSTSPEADASDVDRDSNITITFSEDVTLAGAWYSISCSSTGAHTATVTGGPSTYTLDPDADFNLNESCTVTIDDASVSDVDENDPPDTMAADYSFTFTTELPLTEISQVQGATHLSPYAG